MDFIQVYTLFWYALILTHPLKTAKAKASWWLGYILMMIIFGIPTLRIMEVI